MARGRWVLTFLLAMLISALAGCGGASTANVQNPPPPPVTSVSIGFQPAPPGSIPINATTTLTAVVTKDPSNAGVDWSLSCANVGKCGSLSAMHTDSGAGTTYTPPSTLAGNNQMVNIVAFATADHTQNVTASISVSAFGSSLKGTYVLQAQGTDSSLGPYEFAGVIVLDGNGAITSGEQTANFFDQNVGSLLCKSDAITGGSYFLGPDGRGTITINTGDQDVGVNGTETFSLVFLSNSQALIAQTDFSESATGTMDLQTSTVSPLGGYAFVVSGTDIATASPVAFGGVLNIDSPNNISGNGSITDQNLAGTDTLKQALSGTVTNPDSFGAITLNLTVPGFPTSTTFQFTGYLVDGTQIKLIESDNTSGAGSGATGGIAISQGSATGTFKDDTALSGIYVFGVSGEDLSAFTQNSMTSVGLFTADGSGNLTNGVMDTFLQGNSAQGTAGAKLSAQFQGTYSVDAKGTGRVRWTLSHFVPQLIPAYRPLFFFYVTGSGKPALVLDASDSSVALSYMSAGRGIAYPQSPGPFAFGGDYGFSITQENGTEYDGTGEFTANPAANTLAGNLDMNAAFNATVNNPISGTFQNPPSNGRFSGSLDSLVLAFSPPAVEYYAVDSSHGFFVETDLVDMNAPSGVVSFGYYAARTPVCVGCP